MGVWDLGPSPKQPRPRICQSLTALFYQERKQAGAATPNTPSPIFDTETRKPNSGLAAYAETSSASPQYRGLNE